MTQKLSLNECMLCFGTICEPICLFSVICLETNGEKNKSFRLSWRKMTCANTVSDTQRFITKTIFLKVFFFAECSYNHIDTLLKFMTCFMQKNNDLLNNSKYFKTIQSFRFLSVVTWCYYCRNLDIINLPQMLSTLHVCSSKLRDQDECRVATNQHFSIRVQYRSP